MKFVGTKNILFPGLCFLFLGCVYWLGRMSENNTCSLERATSESSVTIQLNIRMADIWSTFSVDASLSLYSLFTR